VVVVADGRMDGAVEGEVSARILVEEKKGRMSKGNKMQYNINIVILTS
jgi:uncharacterized lipoprotein YajG